MNVFELRNRLIHDYASYVGGFINIADARIRRHVTGSFEAGQLWPDPLIQLNPSFEPGKNIDQLVDEAVLHEECVNVFRKGKTEEGMAGSKVLQLYQHQEEAIRAANSGANYVLTTGTGSGKSLAYIIPIVNHVLKNGTGRGIQAIIIYPMNALANSQFGELEKFLTFGYPGGNGPVTFRRYTGQEGEEERKEIITNPPDIVLTNYVMLELILTRPFERDLIRAAQGLRFLVLDELHTYRGRQGADVALLVRRVREALSADSMQCVGTSATLASGGSYQEQRAEVARVATTLFGAGVTPDNVIGETLQRATPDPALDDPDFVAALRQRIEDTDTPLPTSFNEFVQDPLSVWIESTFGITREDETGRLIRCIPRTISGDTGAANELAFLAGLDEKPCQKALQISPDGKQAEQGRKCHFIGAPFRLRYYVAKTLLDYMRRSLCMDVEFLTAQFQERLVLRSSQRLKPPWAIDEDEKALVHSSWLVPRSSRTGDYGGYKQRDIQNRIIGDASRSPRDKEQAKRLRREAEAQMELLLEAKHVIQSDFYSYRYFASEGFLPGYNFPRLPLSAFIPARRGQQRDEFLSRSRFLAISEFGPKAMVYHEGSKYIINKVILPVEPTGDVSIATTRMKQCPSCGYIHPIVEGDGLDLCERCEHPLDVTLNQLFRLENVSTRRRDRINCDEEERLRLGYELRTGLRFAERGGLPSYNIGNVTAGDESRAKLTYGHAATLWRINLGWARREKKNQYGFVLDVERGYWGSNKLLDDQDPEDPMSPNCARVIPYVEDRKNCLLFEWGDLLSETEFFSLQSALKNAIQVQYQLEESEIAAEPLPDKANPRVILFYEAAEGGAGVLRHLLDVPDALATVATEALRICHFDPATGDDLHMAPGATEECEAACYDCLMTYSNQSHHDQLDRQTIKDILLTLAGSTVKSGPAALPRPEHLERLMRLCQSDLERDWLRLLEARNLRLPTDAQKYVYAGRTCPDFVYEGNYQAAIYIDGPVHDYPERQERDAQQMEMMEDDGWIVMRFRYNDDWEEEITRYPNIFGRSGEV